jgi:hypothetical protein
LPTFEERQLASPSLSERERKREIEREGKMKISTGELPLSF